jgi:DNA-binding winged helix-turn-helix (wHTH) protein
MTEQKQQIYEFDNFRLDVENRELVREGSAVVLPAKAFDMLVVLIQNGGRLIGKDELFSLVWPDQIVEESNLTVQVSALRKALGDRKENPRYIVTVPGHGYRFTGEVLTVNAEDEEVVIERHSVSRVTVETEREISSALEPVSITNVPTYPAGHENAASVQSMSASGSRLAAWMVRSPTVELPGEMRSHHSHARFVLAGGFVLILLAGVFGLSVYISRKKNQARTGAPPFGQTTTRQLTTKGAIALALISPDGKFYAYTVIERGESKQSLWLGQIDGSNDIQLRPPEDLFYNGMAFSNDGKSLYYSTSPQFATPSTLYRMPVLGNVPEKLLSRVGMFISLSPDDRQIAFFRTDETGSSLVTRWFNAGSRRIERRPERSTLHRACPGRQRQTTYWTGLA